MKKLICTILITLICTLVFGYAYAMVCPKCLKQNKESYQNIGDVGIAHRCFDIPMTYKDGKAYATYRCCFGHRYLVLISDNAKNKE